MDEELKKDIEKMPTKEQLHTWIVECQQGPVPEALVFFPTGEGGYEIRKYPADIIDAIGEEAP